MADFASESGHYYRADGSPAYTMIGANGKERPVTLRDARKENLYPSVTTITRLESAPGLVRWQIDQALLSAITLPRITGETDDAFKVRALEDSRQQATKAAEKGTKIHGLIERTIKQHKDTSEYCLIVNPVIEWIHVNLGGFALMPERSFASPFGFGGKIDLHGQWEDRHVIMDFKTKANIDSSKKLGYDQHIMQLAAYANGLGCPNARCINLFIDTENAGNIVPVEWTSDDRDKGWEAFKCLLRLWQIRTGHKPA